MVAGFERIVPKPSPVIYHREFKSPELGEALKEYLKNNGVTVPSGKTSVYLHNEDRSGERCVVLQIEHFEVE